MKGKNLCGLDVLIPVVVCSISILSQTIYADSQKHENSTSDLERGNDRLEYVGDQSRIGIGLDTDFKGRADLSHVFSETDHGAVIGESWVGVDPNGKDKISGAGAKLNYHWTSKNEKDQVSRVNKVFGAYDQNASKDKKVTVGYGQEREKGFWSGHVSKAVSNERKVSTTADGKDIYEVPYEYGVGARAGTFLKDSLVRVQGGVDYEWGTKHSDSEKKPTQITASVGVEKFFKDSPHSVAVNTEVYHKEGGHIAGQKKQDIRGNLMYRYEFGNSGSYLPGELYRRVKVELPGAKRKPVLKKKMTKHTIEMGTDTFFELDKSTLLPQGKRRLNAMIAQMRDSNQEGNILITGHTCDLGTEKYNTSLSERRAYAVKHYLASKKLISNRMIARGLGEEHPKYANTDQERHKNRRVDIEWIGYRKTYSSVVVKTGYTAKPRIVWRRERVSTPPRWVKRALHNTASHKQTVDTYLSTLTNKPINNIDDWLEEYENGDCCIGKVHDTSNTYATKTNQDVEVKIPYGMDPKKLAHYKKHMTGPYDGKIYEKNGKWYYQGNKDFCGTDTYTFARKIRYKGTTDINYYTHHSVVEVSEPNID